MKEIYEKAKWFMKGQDFEGLNRWMLKKSELHDLDILLALLTSTLPVKTKLEARPHVYRVAKMHAGFLDNGDSLLEGLE